MSHRRRARLVGWHCGVFALVLALIGLVMPGVARAQEDSGAAKVEKLAAEAAAAYRTADYSRAVELLERAYQIRQVAALLYNLAKAYEKLGQPDKAVELYRRYIGSSDAEPKLTAKAEARVAAYEESHRPPPRPEPRPREPEPRHVEPDLGLKNVEISPSNDADAARLWSARRKRDRIIGLSLAGVGVAAALVGMGLSVSAYELHKSYANNLDLEEVKRDERDRAKTQALVGDVMYGVAVAAVGVGAYFIWAGYHPEQPPKATAWLAPNVAPTANGGYTAGLVLGGSF